MKNNAEKIKSISIIIVMLIIFAGLIILGYKTIREHYAIGVYDGDSWNRVWPIMVSTVIVIFSTLITSYVFLKDTLDRLADEKPYYTEVIKKYRKEKVFRLMWFSIMLVGVSCYLLICQTAMDDNEEMPFYIYVGVLAVIVLMICSLIFLRSCIKIENSLNTCTKNILKDLGIEIEEEWNELKEQWKKFIDGYAGTNIRDKIEFLEILENNEDQNNAGFDESKFVVRFSEWERFILFFIEQSNDFRGKRNVEQRITVAEGYIENLKLIRKFEKTDAELNGWSGVAFDKINEYDEMLGSSDDERGDTANAPQDERKLEIQEFLNLYRILSKYRDALQVKMDIGIDKKPKHCDFEKKRTTEIQEAILNLLFLLRFYSSVKFLGVLSKIEISYPAAKLFNVDFYNIRFENSSFRVSSVRDTLFARTKMVESNMAWSKFKNCNFYNSYFSDCSLANARFEDCLMTDMTWLDVDVTGSIFQNVDLRNSTFEDSLLINVEIHGSSLEHVDFINCKLEHIQFCEVTDCNLRRCSFAGSIMKEVEMDCCKSGRELQIPKQYADCSENYFRSSFVQTDEQGMKNIEKSPIWESLEMVDGKCCDLSFSSFAGTIAEHIKIFDFIMDASEFSRANLQKSLWNNIRMRGCVMEEVNLTGANLVYLDMESCVLNGATLYEATLKLINLQDSDLTNCHASKSHWTGCLLDRSEMREIDLTRAEFKNSSCRDTILSGAEMTQSRFSEVIFDNCNGQGMLCSYSYFEKCSFFNAFLPDANFNYTVFRNCDMVLASLLGSTIEEAEFENCDFKNSNFRNCSFIRVRFNNNRNITKDIFEGCSFVECVFEGTDEKWHRVFKRRVKHYVVIDRK